MSKAATLSQSPLLRPDREPVLVVVHPGSACGSADFNLGADEAHAARQALVEDISSWTGGVLIIDGELSRELHLDSYADVRRAIQDGLARARDQNLTAGSIYGDDGTEYNQEKAAGDLILRHGLSPVRHNIELTGAWYCEEDTEGCANSVRDIFAKEGFHTQIRDSAVRVDSDYTYAFSGGP